jgi:hypothetical protein
VHPCKSINIPMKARCSSDRRCYSVLCEPCAWRYSLNISRRVLAAHPRRLFALTFAPTLAARTDLRSWRIQVRNLVDHRRQDSKWWRDLGVWGWLGSDGHVRGIVSLGSVLADEFLRAFERRWPTTLKPIEVGTVRNAIYFAMRPGIIFDTGPHHSRYQQIRICIEPSGKLRLTRVLTEQACGSGPGGDAMAVIL